MEQPTLQSNTRITPAQIDALMARVDYVAEHTPGTTCASKRSASRSCKYM